MVVVVIAAISLPASARAADDRVLVDAGWQSVCASTKDREVRCWGSFFGRTAGSKPKVEGIDPAAGPITDLNVISDQACLVQAGLVWCWGTDPERPLLAERIAGVSSVVELATDPGGVSGNSFCALLADGDVACWGDNSSGQVSGDGTTVARPTPQRVEGVTDAVSISVNDLNTCAVRTSGSVLCWGKDAWGAMGIAPRSGAVRKPTEIPGITDAIDVSTNETNTCVIRRSRTVMCLGKNDEGMLGTEPHERFIGATEIPSLRNVVQIAAGTSSQCALDADHHTYCWGWNERGQSGRGTDSRATTSPARVVSLPVATTISGHDSTYCATAPDGIWCWGSGYLAFGNPDVTAHHSNVPVKVADSEDWLPEPDDPVDGIIDTSGPFSQVSVSRDLRCGRRGVGALRPVLFERLSCGTWVRFGERLIGPDRLGLDAVWDRAGSSWVPVDQAESGSGTAADPWKIRTSVRADGVEVEQTDLYVDGSDHVTSVVEVANVSDDDEDVTVFMAGDCTSGDVSQLSSLNPGFGYRWRTTLAGLGSMGGACADAPSGGLMTMITPHQITGGSLAGTEHKETVNYPERIAAQLSTGFGDSCECTGEFDHAAGASIKIEVEEGKKLDFYFRTRRLSRPIEDTTPTPDPENPGGESIEVGWHLQAIGAPKAWAAGLTGKNKNIAILDTGVNADDDWVPEPIAEACWSSQLPAEPADDEPLLADATCFDRFDAPIPARQLLKRLPKPIPLPDKFSWDRTKPGKTSGKGSSQPYGFNCHTLSLSTPVIPIITLDTNHCVRKIAHDRFYQGTRVAAVAAGDKPATSVTKDSEILSANISIRRQSFPSFLRPIREDVTPTGTPSIHWLQDWREERPVAATGDIAAALDWANTLINRRLNKVSVVSLMQPGRLYNTNTGYSDKSCTGINPQVETKIAALNDKNIPVVIPAGDNSNKKKLPWPACLPNVIAVGATDKNRKVIPSSNSSSQLTLLAPGKDIPTSTRQPGDDLLPGGWGTGAQAANYPATRTTGTHLAAAQVAGAIAIYRQKYPDATPKQIKNALRRSGATGHTDPANNRTTPFLRIDRLINTKP